MIAQIIEKFLADPSQIGKFLPFERHAWPYAGVNTGIIANLDNIFTAAEAIDMIGRDQRRQAPSHLFTARLGRAGIIAPIAADRRIAADCPEIEKSGKGSVREGGGRIVEETGEAVDI